MRGVLKRGAALENIILKMAKDSAKKDTSKPSVLMVTFEENET
jgi:hypothetical protein